MASNNTVIISRIQNRRGLKHDLPQPLRPGEIGLTVDSRQVFIGSDSADLISSGYNKVLTFENTTGAKDTLNSIANNQIIAFTVPHIRYGKGEFSGIAKTVSYTPSTPKTYTLSDGTNNTRTVFNANVANNYVLNIASNLAFKASEISVIKNGELLLGDDSPTTAGVPRTSYDYVVNLSKETANTHTISFRTAPIATDEIGITYYSNTAMLYALDGITAGNNLIYSGSTTLNFNDRYSLTDYKKIDPKFVRVNAETGVGYIGLEYKHIAITAETVGVIDTSSLSLGSFLVSRDSQKTSGVTVSGTTGTITVPLAASHVYSNAGIFHSMFVSDAGNTWINNKVINLSNVQSASAEFVLPSGNSWQTARSVTANTAVSGTVVIGVNSGTYGLEDGNYVRFIGTNSTQFDDPDKIYQISNVTSSTFTVTEPSVVASVLSNLDIINYGVSNSGANVQIISYGHGLPTYSNVVLAGSSSTAEISNGTKSILDTPLANTYFIAATSAVSSNVTGTASITLGTTSLSHTPVRDIDLSSQTTLSGAVGVFASLSDDFAWMTLNIIPDTTNQVYFTHKEAYSSVPITFTLHEDSSLTLNSLKLMPGSYDRTNTVKAKLENFLSDLISDTKVDVILTASTNSLYDTSVTNLDSYILDIDNTFDEINFNSRGEANDFSYIVNNLYYEKSSADIKGLVNLKTNLELLTSSAASTLNATASYDTPSSVTITASANAQPIINLDITSGAPAYDSFVIDYSANYSGASLNYQRIGTLYVTGFNNTSGNTVVSLRDFASDATDMTGNISFNASIANNIITVNAVNSLGQQVKINYLTKRWDSR